ncbi:MAG: hypothetical protein IJP61_09020 [Treponema sp.]|nr:hypothetical protein [Treponema sp.]
MKKITALFTIFSILLFTAFSETLTFPILGFRTIPTEPIPTVCDFEESWFGENSARVYHHGICRIACLFSETSYIDIVANPDKNQIYAVYKTLGFADDNIEFHYDDVDYTNKWGFNQCAVSYGLKSIKSSLGQKNLVVMNIRGTPLSHYEWLSNLDLSDETHEMREMHEGYDISANQMKESLDDFMERRALDKSDTFFIITGHSRGASVANMLGAKLADDDAYNKDMIYDYTFGCSNTTLSDDYNNEKYSFIWNISNGEDLVPTTPPNQGVWKYKKFGNEKTLISRWGAKDPVKYETEMLPLMSEYYEKYLCRPYEPFRAGRFFPTQLGWGFDVLYPGMKSYYRRFLGFRRTGEFVFKKLIFPVGKKKQRENAETLKKKKRNFVDVVNDWTGNLIYTYANRCVDMHACESYMSWLMLFDEDEVYTDLENIQITMNGDFEGAILNEKGDVLIEFKNGYTVYKKDRTKKIPAVALTLPGKTVIGLPKNEEFKFLMYKNSIIPCPVSMIFENHDVSGNCLYASEKKTLSLGKGKAVSFSTKDFDFSEGKFEEQPIKVKDFKAATGINPSLRFNWNLQFSMSGRAIPEVGINIGADFLYASLLFEFDKDMYSLNPGLGHRETLFARTILDFNVFSKFCLSGSFKIIPSFRASIAFRPANRFQLFAAGTFDLDTDDMTVEPGFRLGVRF